MSIGLYSKILGSAFVAILAVVWGIASWLQPIDGDLARVGGYAENDFGYRSPQAVFEKNLFKVATSLSEYDKPYDIVLLGDSFSVDQVKRRFGWQNFFINRTGLSMIVFDTRRFWPVEIYESPAFKKYPPKVFVFESVERYLYERVAYFSGMTPTPAAPASESSDLFANATPPRLPLHEELPNPHPGFDPDHVLGHLGAGMQRHIHLNNQVVEIPLAKKGLFSSPNDTDMLVYFDEFKKQTLSESDYSKLRAGAEIFQKIIESNGITRFVLLVAPDKSSTFAPYLKNADQATANLIAELAENPALPVPRTDLVLSRAVAGGQQDIYLPNDSHWGSLGHKLFAQTLADYLCAPAEK
jgi:hypothetical protein